MKRNTDSEQAKNRVILRQKTESLGKGLNVEFSGGLVLWTTSIHPIFCVETKRESICKIVLVRVPGNTDVAHEIRKSYSWKKNYAVKMWLSGMCFRKISKTSLWFPNVRKQTQGRHWCLHWTLLVCGWGFDCQRKHFSLSRGDSDNNRTGSPREWCFCWMSAFRLKSLIKEVRIRTRVQCCWN